MRVPTDRVSHTDDRYLHSELTDGIIGVFYYVYRELGYGFLESVYEEAVVRCLAQNGYKVGRQIAIPVWFRGERIADFKADLVVNDAVLVELKAARSLETIHDAQVLNGLRATSLEVGLLLNFGPRPQVRRLVFSNERKMISVPQCSSAAECFSVIKGVSVDQR